MSGWWKDRDKGDNGPEEPDGGVLGWFAKQLREPDPITLPGEPDEAEPFWTSEQVASHLNVAHAEVWKGCMTNRIKCIRVGREFRIPESEVDRIFREGLPG